MPRSEQAKALAAQQKEQLRAEKLRKKQSDDPKDWGTTKQVRESYKMAHEFDKALPWWLLGAGVVGIAIGVLLGVLFGPMWMWVVLGVLLGLTLAMLVFTRRVRRATFSKFEGQAGSGEVALSMLDKKKWIVRPALAATRGMDVVHRAIGPGGLLLILEGNTKAGRQLLTSEVRRHKQVAYKVDVQTIVMGNDEGQVPLRDLTDHIKKLPKVMTNDKVIEVNNRLKALDSMKGQLPIPKGPMPTRGARQAMRGR